MKTTIKGTFGPNKVDLTIDIGHITEVEAQREGRIAAIFLASVYENMLIEAPSFMDKLYGLLEPIAVKWKLIAKKLEKLADKF